MGVEYRDRYGNTNSKSECGDACALGKSTSGTRIYVTKKNGSTKSGVTVINSLGACFVMRGEY